MRMCHGMHTLCTVTAGASCLSIVESGRNYTLYIEYRYCVEVYEKGAC